VSAPKLRLFVVDDDQAICQLYEDVLSREGYEVVTALDVKTATAKVDELKGDVALIIVDLGLPDGDGTEFARAALGKYGARPTIFVSGWTDEFWQLQDVPGHWIIMQKPISPKKLIAAVNWLLKGGPKPPELDQA